MANYNVRSSIKIAATPRSWNDFFDENFTVQVEHRGVFDCYSKGSDEGHLIVLLHCAVHNALTYAFLCKEISDRAKCKQLCINLRGHGKTFTENDKDFSLNTLTMDIRGVLESLFPNSLPNMILIGNSLGGSIAINLASSLKCFIAVVIMDAVEDMNLKAMSYITGTLINRPLVYEQIEDAILWAVESQCIGNIYSASVSVPGNLWILPNKEFASDQVYQKGICNKESSEMIKDLVNIMIKDKLDLSVENSEFQGNYAHRTGIFDVKPFYQHWYEGLTNKFLSISIPKLLILSKAELLSDALIKAQMLGNFQCDILPCKGLIMHEDKPEVVADIIIEFLKNKIHF